MDVARLNLSHGTPAEHRGRRRGVRDAAAAAGTTVAILPDLAGPKIRLGPLAGGTSTLETGALVPARLRRGRSERGDATGPSTTYPGLAGDLRPGDRILLADGAAELRVDRRDDDGR